MQFLLKLFCIVAIVTFTRGQSCSQQSIGGTTYDMSSLRNAASDYISSTQTSPNDPVYKYKLNFCGPAVDSTCSSPDGQQNNAYVCQYRDNNWDRKIGIMGKWSDATWTKVSDGTVQIFTRNGDSCPGTNNPRTVKITVSCGQTASQVSGTNSGCEYDFAMQHPAACKVKGGSNGGTSDGGSGGMGFGGVFLLIFFIGLFLYIAIGCAVNIKKNEKKGMDAMPNKEFWAGLPGLVKDGVKFTLNGCKSSDGAYETV